MSRDDLLVTGSMERPRQMEVWRTGGDKLTLEGLLRGEELSSVASVLAIHPTRSLSFLVLSFSKRPGASKGCYIIREVFKKSKWKFKMAFAIRGPTPTSNARNKNLRPLFNTNIPPISGK